MLWGNKTAAQNLIDYQADMEILISHINAARSVAVGIYNHNPDSWKVRSFEDLHDQLTSMALEFREAKKTAKKRLSEL